MSSQDKTLSQLLHALDNISPGASVDLKEFIYKVKKQGAGTVSFNLKLTDVSKLDLVKQIVNSALVIVMDQNKIGGGILSTLGLADAEITSPNVFSDGAKSQQVKDLLRIVIPSSDLGDLSGFKTPSTSSSGSKEVDSNKLRIALEKAINSNEAFDIQSLVTGVANPATIALKAVENSPKLDAGILAAAQGTLDHVPSVVNVNGQVLTVETPSDNSLKITIGSDITNSAKNIVEQIKAAGPPPAPPQPPSAPSSPSKYSFKALKNAPGFGRKFFERARASSLNSEGTRVQSVVPQAPPQPLNSQNVPRNYILKPLKTSSGFGQKFFDKARESSLESEGKANLGFFGRLLSSSSSPSSPPPPPPPPPPSPSMYSFPPVHHSSAMSSSRSWEPLFRPEPKVVRRRSRHAKSIKRKSSQRKASKKKSSKRKVSAKRQVKACAPGHVRNQQTKRCRSKVRK